LYVNCWWNWHQHGVVGGNGTPHHPLQSKLSGLLSPTERYTKTLSNGDLRGHHHHIVSSTQNLVPKFGSHHHQHAFRHHHQVWNKSTNDKTVWGIFYFVSHTWLVWKKLQSLALNVIINDISYIDLRGHSNITNVIVHFSSKCQIYFFPNSKY